MVILPSNKQNQVLGNVNHPIEAAEVHYMTCFTVSAPKSALYSQLITRARMSSHQPGAHSNAINHKGLI